MERAGGVGKKGKTGRRRTEASCFLLRADFSLSLSLSLSLSHTHTHTHTHTFALWISALSTQIVEMLFVKDPPMMFWHMSGALQLDYYMVPMSGTFWTIEQMTAPIMEVMALVYKALGVVPQTEDQSCREGSVLKTEGQTCEECPAGEGGRKQQLQHQHHLEHTSLSCAHPVRKLASVM